MLFSQYLFRQNQLDSDEDNLSELSDSTDSFSGYNYEDDDNTSSSSSTPRIAPILVGGDETGNELNTCVETIRNVIGDIGDAELMRLALAADNDSARALNFYFNENQWR